MNSPIRILLVDDSPYFLAAARDFLLLQENFNVVGVAGEPQGMLAQIRAIAPDVILLDLNVGERSGLELIPLIKINAPGIKIIILTVMEEEPYRAAALQAGADAFVRKTEMSRKLISVITDLVIPPADDIS
ncbi:MAG: response regulator [Chloroflexota bacterium]|nr:response regulator transcription factor [Chloroflexota bacterium]MBI5704648.1 response regulator transcription factor [Chloroflexota bacterium]